MTASESTAKRKTGEAGDDSSREQDAPRPAKRAKGSIPGPTKHALLDLYYPYVRTLREYVLAKLPKTSKIRYRKIASVGSRVDPSGKEPTEVEAALGRFLDSTLLGLFDDVPTETKRDNRWEQWISFSQKGDESYVTLSDGARGALFSQAEVGASPRTRW
jgi:telomerase reverse transcriptase